MAAVQESSGEITNRVAQSSLVTFNLEDHYTSGKRLVLDIAPWLHESFILMEKPFRMALKNHDWSQYKDAYVAMYCSTDAIVPAWAYMLVSSYLQGHAKSVVQGDLMQLETQLYQQTLQALDVSFLQDKAVIIKGCTQKPVPPNAYIWATLKLQSVAKSIMYGEACSAVPLFKRQ